MSETCDKREGKGKAKQVPLHSQVHRAAKIISSRKGISLQNFCNDGITSHILRSLTPADMDSADFEALVKKQKRGSKRGGKA